MVSYTVLAGLVLVVLVSSWLARRRRLKHTVAPPEGFRPTNEIFVDPTTGVKQQVWYNTETGARHYHTLPPQ